MARFVGLSIPDSVPLGAPTAHEKYAAVMAARMSGADPTPTKLEGVDFLKAQYYGVAQLMAQKREERGQREAAAAAAGSGSGGGSS